MFTTATPFWARNGDPMWSDVLLLVSGNGTNGATSAPDESSFARSSTAFGAAQLSSAKATLGYATSMWFASSPARFQYPFVVSAPGTTDLTVEGWFSIDGTSFGGYYLLQGSPNNGEFFFELFSNGSTVFFVANTHGPQQLSVAAPIAINTFYHWAYVRDGTTRLQSLYLNGSLLTSSVSPSAYPAMAFTDLAVGGVVGGGSALQGYIQELRITKAKRYTSAFTPPTAPFPRGQG